ncbi:MAG TPA: DnaJ domain-containing protein [Candidatus Micrarchaeia archaeon]|nr:DnaJ domain-containing protein [Candidatus Micrarchaeia archaeon]
MSPALPDVYAVLQADPSTPWPDLRRRYRRRARELHPDVQPVRPPEDRLAASRATRLFAELQAAWSEVSTPERRAAYDLRRRGVRAAPARPAAAHPVPVRPVPPHPRRRRSPAPRPAPWRSLVPVGVVEHMAPGGLHIVVPGEPGDLSLGAFSAFAGAHPGAVLVGEIPAQPEIRRALAGVTLVERLRLTTLVGLPDPPEPRDPTDEDERLWKVDQVRRAFERWADAFPGRRREVPYADDLRTMARLSLAGYQLNPPHPAGLWGAVEPPPASRDERTTRRAQWLVEVELPLAALLLVAAWSEDRRLQRALAQGMPGVAAAASLDADDAAAAAHSLARQRARADGQVAVPDGGPAWGPLAPAARRLLVTFPAAHAFLEQASRPPALPWGAPLARCGTDRDLGDAGSRLVTRVMDGLEARLGSSLELVGRRGGRLTYRAPDAATDRVARGAAEAAGDALEAALGFPVAVPARARPPAV